MRFIGDVHGKFDQYQELIADVPSSIQVGDFGAGFHPIPDIDTSHRFIRGNHDNPEICKAHPNWICDGSYFDGMFFFGGGFSIDFATRSEGVDWWRDEELSIREMYELMDVYQSVKPSVMVTHEAPIGIAKQFFRRNIKKTEPGSRTAQALDALFEIHRPDVWICGHYHKRREQIVKGTRFIILEELGVIDI